MTEAGGERTSLVSSLSAAAAPCMPAGAITPHANQLEVVIPPGAAAGQAFVVTAPDGGQFQVQVPRGVAAGQVIQVQCPVQAPEPQPMASSSSAQAQEMERGGSEHPGSGTTPAWVYVVPCCWCGCICLCKPKLNTEGQLVLGGVGGDAIESMKAAAEEAQQAQIIQEGASQGLTPEQAMEKHKPRFGRLPDSSAAECHQIIERATAHIPQISYRGIRLFTADPVGAVAAALAPLGKAFVDPEYETGYEDPQPTSSQPTSLQETAMAAWGLADSNGSNTPARGISSCMTPTDIDGLGSEYQQLARRVKFIRGSTDVPGLS